MKTRLFLKSVLLATAAVGGFGLGAARAAEPLHIAVYNPGAKGVFPVSSEIVSGNSEVVLIDAQFRRSDAQALVDKIKATRKNLTTVFVSQSDPDYYFGLDEIKTAFPKVRILATPETVKAIKANMEGKLAYWGPILKDEAPEKLILPQPLHSDHFLVDGQRVEIKGLRGPDAERTYLWVPSTKTMMGGVVVNSGVHVFMADTQTPASQQAWLKTLAGIDALKPTRVIPGHYLGALPKGAEAARFTANYIKTFQQETAKAKDSAALIAAMKAKYPHLGSDATLELSAKVAKGEMQWPAPLPTHAAEPAKTSSDAAPAAAAGVTAAPAATN